MHKEKGAVLIAFMLLAVVLIIGVASFYAFAFADFRASLRNEWMTQAMYVAEAGIDQKLVQLAAGNNSNVTGNLNFDVGGNHQGSYSVFYGVVATDPDTGGNVAVNPVDNSEEAVSGYAVGDEVIISTGTVTLNGTQVAQRELRATVQSSPLIAPRGAVVAKGNAQTYGSITIDGRNHDINGNLIVGDPGVFGVSATGTFSLQGASEVGGNGIAPTGNPGNPATYEVNAPDLPSTPEEILGLSQGALDQYKTSTPPSGAFSGIVYLTTNWDAADLSGSSGILIVHNDAGDATLSNIHANTGIFKGLIIMDRLDKINGNGTFLGAVYTLNAGGDLTKIGNGNADIKYSSAVLAGLPLVNYRVTSWEDTRNG
ncbi:MAG: hypothetical protein HY447_00840 [Candidatus Omnitrophica bacterium]|nr:hypothetical protein [Candidatus Omnitrophota bacterium]